jgi:hypothetical protein
MEDQSIVRPLAPQITSKEHKHLNLHVFCIIPQLTTKTVAEGSVINYHRL